MKKTNPKILIVDDDEGVCGCLRDICVSAGCDVKISSEASAALEVLKGEPFHLVISDVRMPHMDGVSFLDALEKEQIDVPVVMMTGYTDYSPEKIDELNAVALLQKPFSGKQVREIIEHYVQLLPSMIEQD